MCPHPIDYLEYMYPSSDKETRIEWKNTKGNGRREGIWKHLITIAEVLSSIHIIIQSPVYTITGQVAAADINKNQADR